MAIDFNCPHCHHPYRLKDEFAGKRATCKNPDCRQVIVVPKPITVPEDGTGPSAAELEAAALSALSDERAQEAAPREQVIHMTCTYCEHKWTEPFAKAGKNTLCPNPECRQRIKVPEPKADDPIDWRQTKTRLPSGAKQNFEKMEGVADAAEARFVTGTALREAGATGVEIEPRTLKEKMVIGLTLFGLLAGAAFGVWYLVQSRKTTNDDHLVADARAAFTESSKELAPDQVGLCSALLNGASAEYTLRKNSAEHLKQARTFLVHAREDLQKQAPSYEQNALAAEFLQVVIDQGGSEEQVKDQIRYRWVPDLVSGKLRMNERVHTVYEELRQWLTLLNQGDFDFRVSVARKLTRDLVKKGQRGMAAEIIPMSLFSNEEKDEARAIVALELYRLDHDAAEPVAIAKDLQTQYAAGKGTAPTILVQTLFVAVLKQQPRGAPADVNRVLTGVNLLEGKADEAMKLALGKAQPEVQLKSLVLCAEWMPSPGPALDEARKLINESKGKRDVKFASALLVRLSGIAASAGMAEHAHAFAGFIPEEGTRVWAIGNAVHLQLAANPKDKVEEAAVELPEDLRKLRVGQAWAMYWIARRNAMTSGDREGEKKAVSAWAPPLKPFGLAGAALGLQDR